VLPRAVMPAPTMVPMDAHWPFVVLSSKQANDEATPAPRVLNASWTLGGDSHRYLAMTGPETADLKVELNRADVALAAVALPVCWVMPMVIKLLTILLTTSEAFSMSLSK